MTDAARPILTASTSEPRPHWIIVTTRRDPDAPAHRQRVNYHSKRARTWLETHLWHHMHHGGTVTFAPCEPGEEP